MGKTTMVNESIYFLYVFNCSVGSDEYLLHDGYNHNLIASVIAEMLLIVPIIILNALVIIVISRRANLNTTSNFLLANTAVCDIMTTICIPLHATVRLMADNKKHDCILYTIQIGIKHLFPVVSYLMVNFVALDRFIAITKPFFYEEKVKSNRKIYKVIMAFLWLTPLLAITLAIAIPYYNALYYSEGTIYFASILLNVYIYLKILRIIRRIQKERRRQHEQYNVNDIKEISNADMRATLLTFLMFITIIIFYIPYLITTLIWMYGGHRSDEFYLAQPWIFNVVLTKSLINPLLYCFSLQSIRYQIKNVLTRAKKRNLRIHSQSMVTMNTNFTG